MKHAESRILPYSLLVLTMLVWAGNLVVGRAARDTVPPIALAFWRWVVATAVLVPLAGRELGAARATLVRHWRLLLALGLTGIAAYNPLLYTGLRDTTAINASLLLCATPILVALSSRVVLRSRGGIAQWVGIAVSLAGALVIVSAGSPLDLGHLALGSGDLWIAAAVVVWTAFTVLLARRPASLSPLLTQLVITLVGLPFLAVLYFLERASGQSLVLSGEALFAIGYAGVLAAVVAYVLWARGVKAVGPTRAGLFLYLIPVFSAALSSLLLGESVHAFQLVGAVLIFSGVGLTSWSRPPEASARVPSPKEA